MWPLLLSTVLAAPVPMTVRVIGAGAGLCSVVSGPHGGYVVFDAGGKSGTTCLRGILATVPEDASIDALVLSHVDADHIKVASKLLRLRKVERIVVPDGLFDEMEANNTWSKTAERLRDDLESCSDRVTWIHGPQTRRQRLGRGWYATVLAGGWDDRIDDWFEPKRGADSHRKNARSVAIRMDRGKSSVLFMGDAKGKDHGDDTMRYAEAAMVELATTRTTRVTAQVLIAGHHGGDDATSADFLAQVQPEAVIFAAGDDYRHPRDVTVERVLALGDVELFRTDAHGKDEGSDEWSHAGDPAAYDDGTPMDGAPDVVSELYWSGEVTVRYAPPLPATVPRVSLTSPACAADYR